MIYRPIEYRSRAPSSRLCGFSACQRVGRPAREKVWAVRPIEGKALAAPFRSDATFIPLNSLAPQLSSAHTSPLRSLVRKQLARRKWPQPAD